MHHKETILITHCLELQRENDRLESNIALASMILKDFYTEEQEQQIRRALVEGVGP